MSDFNNKLVIDLFEQRDKHNKLVIDLFEERDKLIAENEVLKQRIKRLVELGLETSEYGLQTHREMWEKEAGK